MSTEREGHPEPLRSVSNGSAAPALVGRPALRSVGEQTPTPGIHIVRTGADVEAGSVLASFELDAMPHPMWRGALSRALDGSLTGIAGRWHLEHLTIKVKRVQAARAGDVASAVQTAVESANAYAAERADEGAARLAAAVNAEGDLRRDARVAAAALHAALGV